MQVQDLQTEIAARGYGPTMVLFWDIINSQHQDLRPQDQSHWREVWRAADGIREDIRQEAWTHLKHN